MTRNYPGLSIGRALFLLPLGIACGARTDLPTPLGSGGEGGDGLVTCTDGTLTLVRAEPTVMLVIDASWSMLDAIADRSGSRWDTLLDGFAATLPERDREMQIGALIYPGSTARELSCEVSATVDLPPSLGNVGPLLMRMATQSPRGATPTAEAIQVAAGALDRVRAASGARALLLATDGAPNCNEDLDPKTCTCLRGDCARSSRFCLDDARTIDTIAGQAAEGIPTYVVGLLGADEDENLGPVLDAMAVAGGRPRELGSSRYFAATSPEALAEALVTIRDQVGACVYLTSSVPGVEGTITVSWDGTQVPYDETGATGWRWGSRDNGEIWLSDALCALVDRDDPRLIATVACEAPVTSGGAGGGGAGGSARAP